MSQGSLCRLCVKISNDHRSLYHEDGHENEVYELMIKYFDPKVSYNLHLYIFLIIDSHIYCSVSLRIMVITSQQYAWIVGNI